MRAHSLFLALGGISSLISGVGGIVSMLADAPQARATLESLGLYPVANVSGNVWLAFGGVGLGAIVLAIRCARTSERKEIIAMNGPKPPRIGVQVNDRARWFDQDSKINNQDIGVQIRDDAQVHTSRTLIDGKRINEQTSEDADTKKEQEKNSGNVRV